MGVFIQLFFWGDGGLRELMLLRVGGSQMIFGTFEKICKVRKSSLDVKLELHERLEVPAVT